MKGILPIYDESFGNGFGGFSFKSPLVGKLGEYSYTNSVKYDTNYSMQFGYNSNSDAWNTKFVFENDVAKGNIGAFKWATGFRSSNNVAVPSVNLGLSFGTTSINLEFRGKN